MSPPAPPSHLSQGAREYLLQPDMISYPDDWTDPWSVQDFRDRAHPLWCGVNERLDFDYRVEAEQIAGVVVERIRVGKPPAGRALLHFHGGMYCSGTPEIDRVMNAPIARDLGVEVISVDYRLAPEYPFPGAVDDALAVYRALVDDGVALAVYGESAGGGLAAACVVAARAEGIVAPVALVLMSPMLDLTGGSDTYRTLQPVDPDYHEPSVLLEPGAAYAGSTALDHPLVSPLFADLTGLPPMLVQAGGREVLLGDSVRFARRARAAGVDVTLEVLDGGWHNWPLWYGLPEADDAIASVVTHLRDSFS